MAHSYRVWVWMGLRRVQSPQRKRSPASVSLRASWLEDWGGVCLWRSECGNPKQPQAAREGITPERVGSLGDCHRHPDHRPHRRRCGSTHVRLWNRSPMNLRAECRVNPPARSVPHCYRSAVCTRNKSTPRRCRSCHKVPVSLEQNWQRVLLSSDTRRQPSRVFYTSL